MSDLLIPYATNQYGAEVSFTSAARRQIIERMMSQLK